MAAPKGNGLDAANDQPAKTQTNNAADSTKQARFTGTDNPRQLRALAVLLRRPVSREALDHIAGCSNGPELVAELRRRGLDVPCERIRFIDRDGCACRPGVYSLSIADRRKIYAWMGQRQKGGKA